MSDAKGQPQIAFLGTGIMGSRQARRLLGAGFPVRAWNRTRAKAEALAAQGAQVQGAPAEAARGAEVVITMLADAPAVAEVLFEEGVADALAAGAVVIDMSSIPPAVAREHARRLGERGIAHLDAPVSGGAAGAEQGTLAIMVGGEAAIFARMVPVFTPMGRPTHVGPSGAGQLSKLCNQIIVAVTIGAVSEALLLAAAGGADPAKVREALTGGFADSRILQMHGKRMLDRNFVAGGPSRLQLKDLRTILAAAREAGVTLPMASRVAEMFEVLVRQGFGDADHAALLLELERMNTPLRVGDGEDRLVG